MSKPTFENYVSALYDQLLETPVKNRSKLIKNFAQTVAQHDQSSIADKIIQQFSDLCNQKENSLKISLVSATKLNNLFTISKIISDKLQIDVELINLVSSNIIGGLVMYFADYKIDFSLKNILSKKNTNQDFICMDKNLKTIINIIDEQHDLLFADELPHTKSPKVEIINITVANKPNLDKIEKELSANLAKKVIIHYHSDKKLIGGIIFEYDLKQVDQSINHILENS